MTHPEFPFPMLGAVHARNELTQHQAVKFNSKVDINVRYAGCRRHKRGTEVDFIAEVRDAGPSQQLLWENTTTILYFHSHPKGTRVDGSACRPEWMDKSETQANNPVVQEKIKLGKHYTVALALSCCF